VTKITTADCRKFLVSDPEVQGVVEGRYDMDDADLDPFDDAEEIVFFSKVLENGKNPKKWKRVRKYNVGSKTDTDEGCNFADNEFVKQMRGVDPTGGVVREFWLEDTDHVTVAILEKDGKLYYLDDLSD